MSELDGFLGLNNPVPNKKAYYHDDRIEEDPSGWDYVSI